MKTVKATFILFAVLLHLQAFPQISAGGTSLSLFVGMVNYQGDLNPHSFTLQQANPAFGILVKQPLTSRFYARAGFFTGHVDAADRNNRDYLKPRNLSFQSTLQELQLGLEVDLLSRSRSRVVPYMFGCIALFHFNPWTYNKDGNKTFLKPLSTEGQGLSQFPTQHPYKLYQWSLPFGGGIKIAFGESLLIGLQFSQRKTFTDYLDDVSSFFVDEDILLQEKGPAAVDLAYRGDELPGGLPYPMHGEQRGTPKEMDWYYMFGVTVEMDISSIKDLLSGSGDRGYNRCPRNVW